MLQRTSLKELSALVVKPRFQCLSSCFHLKIQQTCVSVILTSVRLSSASITSSAGLFFMIHSFFAHAQFSSSFLICVSCLCLVWAVGAVRFVKFTKWQECVSNFRTGTPWQSHTTSTPQTSRRATRRTHAGCVLPLDASELRQIRVVSKRRIGWSCNARSTESTSSSKTWVKMGQRQQGASQETTISGCRPGSIHFSRHGCSGPQLQRRNPSQLPAELLAQCQESSNTSPGYSVSRGSKNAHHPSPSLRCDVLLHHRHNEVQGPEKGPQAPPAQAVAPCTKDCMQ